MQQQDFTSLPLDIRSGALSFTLVSMSVCPTFGLRSNHLKHKVRNHKKGGGTFDFWTLPLLSGVVPRSSLVGSEGIRVLRTHSSVFYMWLYWPHCWYVSQNSCVDHVLYFTCQRYSMNDFYHYCCRTCLRYFLPPNWIMDKDAISTMALPELAAFPLDDFFDHYEKGLRKVSKNQLSNSKQLNFCNLNLDRDQLF